MQDIAKKKVAYDLIRNVHALRIHTYSTTVMVGRGNVPCQEPRPGHIFRSMGTFKCVSLSSVERNRNRPGGEAALGVRTHSSPK